MSEDNWTKLTRECEPLFDKHFIDINRGKTYTFFGLVWASDDLYYGMSEHGTGKTLLLSCVGSITGHGFEQTKVIAPSPYLGSVHKGEWSAPAGFNRGNVDVLSDNSSQ